jgi:hypothetical protein
MTEQPLAVTSMHDDHRIWNSESEMWKQDLGIWSRQIEVAFGELDELQQMLSHQRAVLDEHEQRILEQEKRQRNHEQELAKCERLRVPYDDASTAAHLETGKFIDQTRIEHKRIKDYHHKLMAKMRDLEKTMDAPM